MLLVNVVAQFTAKTTNSVKVIYFLLLTFSSINKLKSHMLFTCKDFMQILFSDLTLNVEKRFLLQEMVGG